MIIFLLPIIDFMLSSFSATSWPLFTVYGTFWYLLTKAQIWAILPQIWLLKCLQISYFEIFVISLLQVITLQIKHNLYKKSVIFLLFCTIYYLIHIYNYGVNLIAFGILFLIAAVMWYTENKGKLDNRFV